MNGDTEMPTITFGGDCTYDTLDTILNGNQDTGYAIDGSVFGWGVRVWLKQGVIITALWGATYYDYEFGNHVTRTSLLAWSDKDQDYNNLIEVDTDDITKIEIL